MRSRNVDPLPWVEGSPEPAKDERGVLRPCYEMERRRPDTSRAADIPEELDASEGVTFRKRI